MTGPVQEERLRPSGWWYALGGGLVAGGAVLAAQELIRSAGRKR